MEGFGDFEQQQDQNNQGDAGLNFDNNDGGDIFAAAGMNSHDNGGDIFAEAGMNDGMNY